MDWTSQDFDHYQITEIERGYAEGINIDIYADIKYSHGQMHQIRLGLLDGIDITQYVDENFTYAQMREVRLAMQEQHDPSVLADPRYSSAQMAAINIGLNWNLDVTKYADPSVQFYTMLKMKDYLLMEAQQNVNYENTPQVSGISNERETQQHTPLHSKKKSHDIDR